MRYNRRLGPWALLTLALLQAFFVTGQTTWKMTVPSDCLDSIPYWMEQYKIPITAASILENGKIKQVKIFGKMDDAEEAPLNTIFNVASLTKPVTALVVLKLIDARKLDLDEPLYKYWIDADIKEDDRYKKLTPKIVLSHQTGFPNWRSDNPQKKLAFLFSPGTKYGYSGEGFEYLRRALEIKFGQTLQQLADSILFKPLKMSTTHYGWDEHMDSTQFANPHDKNGSRIPMARNTQIVSADWLVTTITDYSKFGLAVMDGALLSHYLFAEMVRPQVKMEGKPKENMGLGWEVITPLENNEYLLMHTGSDDGVKTLIILFPQSKRGMILFSNGNNGFDLIKKVIKKAFAVKELTP